SIKATLLTLCHESCSVSAYNTAWLARVPKYNDLEEPEFPECISWVRKNQAEDGSWGREGCSVAEKIFSSLMSTFALAQWNEEHADDQVIKRGIEALNSMKLEGPLDNLVPYRAALITCEKDARKYGL